MSISFVIFKSYILLCHLNYYFVFDGKGSLFYEINVRRIMFSGFYAPKIKSFPNMEKDFSEKSYFHKACGIIKSIVAKSIL